jgi:isopentenyldiphosphate isomerase
MLFRRAMGSRLIPRIYKVLLQRRSNQKNSFKTWAKDLKRHFFPNELQIATKHIIQRGAASLAVHHEL